MIGLFDFYPIGAKGQLTKPVNTCFLQLATDETSTFAFRLAPIHTACDFYSIAGKGDLRDLWDLLTTCIYDFVDRIFDGLNAIPFRIPRICLIYSR